MATEKYRWTKEADDTVRAMLESGHTVADVCDALGITDKQLSNRVSVLRRSDATFPRLNRGEHAVEDCEEVTEACEPEVKLEPKGELNPLEQEMARMIEEQERMISSKEEKICKMQGIIEGLEARIDILQEKIAKKDRVIAGMAEELYS